MRNHTREHKKKALSKQVMLAITMSLEKESTKLTPSLNSKRISRISIFKCNRQSIQAILHLVLEQTKLKQLSNYNPLLSKV